VDREDKQASLKDCFKGFKDRGIAKVISPEETCTRVLRKLQTAPPYIYKHNIFIERPTGIPQYRIIGTDYYRDITGVAGANGKGHTKEQALASGLMELAERYSCFKYLQGKHSVSSWEEMLGNPFEIEDFCSQFMGGRVKIDYQKLRDAKIRWVRGSTLEGEMVSLPINLINSVLQGTNGMAAGNSFEEALLHAICEVIERHCLTIIEYLKLRTPVIKQESINSQIALRLIERFKSIGLSPVVKDFSLGLGLPVMGVIIRFGKKECNISAGVATHREEALVRALTEISQSLGVGGSAYKISSHQHYFENSHSISFEEVPCVDNNNMRLEIESIRGLLQKKNMKVFYVDMTDKLLNIPSVDVYISGAKYYDKRTGYKNSSIMLVDESLSLGDLKAAKARILEGINSKDKNMGVYCYYMAYLLLIKSQYKEAIRYFLKSIGTFRFNKEIKKESLAGLGICYENAGKVNLAVDAYTKLLDLSKNEGLRSLEKLSRVQSFIPQGRPFSGKSLYEEIKIARWRSQKKGQKLFINEFRKYQAKRNHLTRLLNKALDYFDSGNYHDCYLQVKKIILPHPLVSKIYDLNLLLAQCLFEMHQYKNAVNELLKAEKIDPDNGKINFTLARYYKRTGQNKKYLEETDKGFQKTSAIFKMKVNLFDTPRGRAGWIRKVV